MEMKMELKSVLAAHYIFLWNINSLLVVSLITVDCQSRYCQRLKMRKNRQLCCVGVILVVLLFVSVFLILYF